MGSITTIPQPAEAPLKANTSKVKANTSKIIEPTTEKVVVKLIDVQEVDQMFPVATAAAISIWISLLLLVYSLVPPEEYVYLEGAEREASAAACYVFMVSIGLSLIPLYVQRLTGEKREISGILYALIAVQFIAMITNGLMAWFPTVVVVDPVTHARVYLLRWCEWIPLAGLLTFLSEIVDCHTGIYGVLLPVLSAFAQSLSCVMALLFPFCPTLRSWIVAMTLSFILWACIFPRLYYKYKAYKNIRNGISIVEMEVNCRIKFGFHLLLSCSILWTGLVVLYFANWAAFVYYPDSILVKNEALPMILDTLFDVSAKALYMKLIVNVHQTVFDAEGRAGRQLDDLKRMISVLWEASSDVIVISVKHASGISTMISPTFPCMIGAAAASVGTSNTGSAILVKSEEIAAVDGDDKEGSLKIKSSSYVVDASEIPYYAAKNQSAELPEDDQIDDLVNEQAGCLVQAAWNGLQSGANDENAKSGKKQESLVVLDLRKTDGTLIKCEIKLSRHSNNAVIAVVRDVTERYLRFDAERRAHKESLARQKDAQSVNRFTRHEIKNGLLAGIELCHEVSKHVDAIKASLPANEAGSEGDGTSMCITELDSTLHDVLDTVLAEAMAREIVHESYEPKVERVDLRAALTSVASIQDEAIRNRYPINVCPADTPFLSMDPQLLKYIHRNAVSNACKYGRKGGKVTTEVHYFIENGGFAMDVINEPGPKNEALLSMGDSAAKKVFAQGERLGIHTNGDEDNHISSGDGAWIMQKCAKTMDGACSIRFELHETVFSFRCKVEPYTLPWKANAEFQVPPDTWGLAFDDSTIQRKLVKRIMLYAGIDEDRIIVKGKHASDIRNLDRTLAKVLARDNDSNLLVLMDENLDYNSNGANVCISGSKHAERALRKLTSAQRSRVFVMVRSANDADSDVALYNERTHGFFPKATIHKDRVRELLARAWFQRFPIQAEKKIVAEADLMDHSYLTSEDRSSSTTEKCSSENSDEKVTRCLSTSSFGRSTKDEILASSQTLDKIIKGGSGDGWNVTWSRLHNLKGDLLALDFNKNIELCITLINGLRADNNIRPPLNLDEVWERVQSLVLEEVQ